jgi:deoxyribonuclease-4
MAKSNEDTELSPPRFGVHTSIAGGLHKALHRGAELGCDVVQIFTKSTQQWAAKSISDEELEAWQEARRRTGVEPALAHASYLINLASPDPAAWRRSCEALALEYERCRRLSIPYLVVHPGSHMGSGEAAGVRRIIEAINWLHEELAENPTKLLLENTAGQGTSMGHVFAHLRDIFSGVSARKRLGVCIDTCHAVASGYGMGTNGGWGVTAREIARTVKWRNVKAFHINDSMRPRGSRRDRHVHIGQGELGLTAFCILLNDSRLSGLPCVLETPKTGERSDAINLSVLRTLYGVSRVTQRAKKLANQLHGD